MWLTGAPTYCIPLRFTRRSDALLTPKSTIFSFRGLYSSYVPYQMIKNSSCAHANHCSLALEIPLAL